MGVVLDPKGEPEYSEKGGFGTYNPTVARFGNVIRMLYRFAKREPFGENDHVDKSDIRLAVSDLEGQKFLREGIVLDREGQKEEYGVEDPRSQLINDESGPYHLITYTANPGQEEGNWRTRVGLATTTDFKKFERKGYLPDEDNGRMIFGDKDVVVFPGKIGDKYWMMRRPNFNDGNDLNITLTSSEDLFSGWGIGETIPLSKMLSWSNWRSGAGTQPLGIDYEGQRVWLELFHGVEGMPNLDKPGELVGKYRMGGIVFTEEKGELRPTFICKDPLLEPEEEHEREGLVSNVVFPTGLVVVDEIANVYYGAGDGVVALCKKNVNDLVKQIIENSL